MPFNNADEVVAAIEKISSQHLRSVVSVYLQLIREDPTKERFYLGQIESILQRKVPSAFVAIRQAEFPTQVFSSSNIATKETTLGLKDFITRRYSTGSTADMVVLMQAANQERLSSPTIQGLKAKIKTAKPWMKNVIRTQIEHEEARLTKQIIDRGSSEDAARRMKDAIDRVGDFHATSRITDESSDLYKLAETLYNIKRQAYDTARGVTSSAIHDLSKKEMDIVRRIATTPLEELGDITSQQQEALGAGLNKVYQYVFSLDTGVDQPAPAFQPTLFGDLPRGGSDVNIGGNLHRLRMPDAMGRGLSAKSDLVPVREIIDPKVAGQNSMQQFLASLVPEMSGEDLNKTHLGRQRKLIPSARKKIVRRLRVERGLRKYRYNGPDLHREGIIRAQARATIAEHSHVYIKDTLASLGLDVEQESAYLPRMSQSLQGLPRELEPGGKLISLPDTFTTVTSGSGFSVDDPDMVLISMANSARASGNKQFATRIEKYLRRARGLKIPSGGSQAYLQSDVINVIGGMFENARLNHARLMGYEVVPTGSQLYLKSIETVLDTFQAPQSRIGQRHSFTSVVKMRAVGVPVFMKSPMHSVLQGDPLQLMEQTSRALASVEGAGVVDEVERLVRDTRRMRTTLRGKTLGIGERYSNSIGTLNDARTGNITFEAETFLGFLEKQVLKHELTVGEAADLLSDFQKQQEKTGRAIAPLMETRLAKAVQDFVSSPTPTGEAERMVYEKLGMRYSSSPVAKAKIVDFAREMSKSLDTIIGKEVGDTVNDMFGKEHGRQALAGIVRRLVSTNEDISNVPKLLISLSSRKTATSRGRFTKEVDLDFYASIKRLISTWSAKNAHAIDIKGMVEYGRSLEAASFIREVQELKDASERLSTPTHRPLTEILADLLDSAGIKESKGQRATRLKKLEESLAKPLHSRIIGEGVDRTIGKNAQSVLEQIRILAGARDMKTLDGVSLLLESYIDAVKQVGGKLEPDTAIKTVTKLINNMNPDDLDSGLRSVWVKLINARLAATGSEPVRSLGLNQIIGSLSKGARELTMKEVNHEIGISIGRLYQKAVKLGGEQSPFATVMKEISGLILGRTSTEPWAHPQDTMRRVVQQHGKVTERVDNWPEFFRPTRDNLKAIRDKLRSTNTAGDVGAMLSPEHIGDIEAEMFDLFRRLAARAGVTIPQFMDNIGEDFRLTVPDERLSEEAVEEIQRIDNDSDGVAQVISSSNEEDLLAGASKLDIEEARKIEAVEVATRYSDQKDMRMLAEIETSSRQTPLGKKYSRIKGRVSEFINKIVGMDFEPELLDPNDEKIKTRLKLLYQAVIETSGSPDQAVVLARRLEIPGLNIEEAVRASIMLRERDQVAMQYDAFMFTGTRNLAGAQAGEKATLTMVIDRSEKTLRPIDNEAAQIVLSHSGAKFGAVSYKQLDGLNRRLVEAGISESDVIEFGKRINPWLENEKSLKAIDILGMYSGVQKRVGAITGNQVIAKIYEQTGLRAVAGDLRKFSQYSDKMTPIQQAEMAVVARKRGDTVIADAFDSFLSELKQEDLVIDLSARGKKVAEKTAMDNAREVTAPVREALSSALDTNDVNVTKAIKEAWEGSPSLRTGTYVIAAVAGASAVYSMIKRRGKGNNEAVMGLDRPGSEAITRVSPNDSGYAALQAAGQPEYTPEGLAYGNPNGSSSTINVQDNMRSISSADLNGMIGG